MPFVSSSARSVMCVVFCGSLLVSSFAGAAEMRIDYIEIFGSNYVNIHFETVADRTYALQYRNSLSASDTNWTNLYVAQSLPFPNHYVVSDFRTNSQRFYRLRITR